MCHGHCLKVRKTKDIDTCSQITLRYCDSGVAVIKVIRIRGAILLLGMLIFTAGSLSSPAAGAREVDTVGSLVPTLIEPAGVPQKGTAVPLVDPDWPFDVWVPALSYYYLYAVRYTGTGLYGRFDVTSSGGIDFFVCDQSNFDLWTSGYTASVYALRQNIGGANWTLIVPTTDTWYIMYSNMDSIFMQAHVIGTNRIDITAPSIDLNLQDEAICMGTVQIDATLTHEGFPIESVQLRIDDVLTDTEDDSQFSYAWDTTKFADGGHAIGLTARDDVGNIEYVVITVRVSNERFLVAFGIAIGGIAIVAAAVVLFNRRKHSGAAEVPLQTLVQGPGLESQPSGSSLMPESQTIGFCPHCGTPRQLPAARFCPNCGYQFQQ